jgi:hypothetical protein
MRVDVVVTGVLVLLAMVGISVYGWIQLPPDARVPIHHGIGGWGNWQPKRYALITYPVVGAVVYAVVLSATSHAASPGKTAPEVIAPLVLLVIFFSQYFAVMAAIRKKASGDDY